MAALCRGPDGTMILFVKGAPEALFAMTLPEDIGYWENAISDAGNEGEPVLAFGAKEMPSDTVRFSFAAVLAGAQLLGLVGFIDPPRLEANEAFASCRSAGIDVKLITGAPAAPALALARQ